jgi:hypothetical protein
MTQHEPLLKMKVEGPAVESGRISVDDLTQLLKKVQICAKRLGQVLRGQVSTVKQGRLQSDIENACTLDVVGLGSGCVEVGLDIPAEQKPEDTLLGVQQPLGKSAIEKMLEGIDLLGEDQPHLLNEFDYGVLVGLRDVAHILDRGVSLVRFSYRGNGQGPRFAALTPRVRDRVLENITAPMRSAVQVEGALREVNLERHTCQIYPQVGSFIQCQFEDRHEPAIKEFLDLHVIAKGEAVLREADGRIKTMRIEDIECCELAPDLVAGVSHDKPKSGKELLAALRATGLVGMWRDRTDITDSIEYARALRERGQRRERG